MSIPDGFSDPLELPNIPEGPGVCTIEDANGRVLQVAMSQNIRRRIGELLDSEGNIAVHGPKIYAAQQQGKQIFVRWKLTPDYRREKRRLVEELGPLWGRQEWPEGHPRKRIARPGGS
jgi:hypothetical protein